MWRRIMEYVIILRHLSGQESVNVSRNEKRTFSRCYKETVTAVEEERKWRRTKSGLCQNDDKHLYSFKCDSKKCSK